MPPVVTTIAPETAALVALFVAVPVGGTVTHADMSASIGRPIGDRRHLIPRVMHIAARDHGAIFGSVRGVGYQRLAPSDAHMLGAHSRRRMRRTAKRTADAIVSAVTKANDIAPSAKLRAYAEINAAMLVRHLLTDREVTAATTEPKPEPVALIMRRFARQIGAVD